MTMNPLYQSPSGWWFGTFFIFHFISGIILPIDVHIFQRGCNHQPAQVAAEFGLYLGAEASLDGGGGDVAGGLG
jgi:hypothetical protein